MSHGRAAFMFALTKGYLSKFYLMTLTGFERWNVYEKKYDNEELPRYLPSQGDVLTLNNTPDGVFLICITNCCDAFDFDYNNLSFVTAFSVGVFMRTKYIEEKYNDLLERKKNGRPDDFGNETKKTIVAAASKENIGKYYSSNTKKNDCFREIFENKAARFVFMPHNEHFEKDLIIDLQDVVTINIERPEACQNINECISDEAAKVKNLYAKLDYLYRDYIMQKIGAYMSRVSLPARNIPKKIQNEGFWFEVFDRAIGDLK